MTKEQQTEIEAAAFRALIAHLQQRSDVQNIDLMNLAGFVATVYQNGIRQRRRKPCPTSTMPMHNNTFMV